MNDELVRAAELVMRARVEAQTLMNSNATMQLRMGVQEDLDAGPRREALFEELATCVETYAARIKALEAQVREMEGILRTVAFRAQDAKRLCEDGHPVSAYNLSSGILGQIGGHVATLTGEKP